MAANLVKDGDDQAMNDLCEYAVAHADADLPCPMVHKQWFFFHMMSNKYFFGIYDFTCMYLYYNINNLFLNSFAI
jgi:hypothetical protein